VDWVSEVAAEPDEVRRLAGTSELLAFVKRAVELAGREFPAGSRVSLQVEQDPESVAQWLAVDVAVKKGATGILDCYDRFTAQWIAEAPADARRLVCLTFRFV
jgi:hypothetical protein